MHEHRTALRLDERTLDRSVELLQNDQIVAVPTETVYGLAGNCLSPQAVRRIFEVKGRPLVDPLISHFKDTDSVFSHVYENPEARILAEAFWPGPLTLILPKKPSIPDLVTAGLPSAGVRVPKHPTFRALLSLLPFPLAAPSANPFGYVSPTKSEHVFRTLGTKIPAIVEGGSCAHGLESTIIDMRQGNHPVILRPGPISASDITDVLGISPTQVGPTKNHDDAAQIAPGMLTKHYSPNSKLSLLDYGTVSEEEIVGISGAEGSAIVLQQRPEGSETTESVYWLSEDGSPETAAKNLFDLLQKLELARYSDIAIEKSPEGGIGTALNDRLRRAAAE